jgi:serine/threonine-protein kinase
MARHRLAVGSAAAVLLALLAGLAIALWQADVARGLARRADAEARRANAEAERAEHEAAQALEFAGRVRRVKEFFVSAFVQADPLRRSDDSPLTIDAAFDTMLERAKSELAADPVLQADVFDDFGEVRVNQGRVEEARALFDQALVVAEREFGADHPAVAESSLNLAVVASYEGHPAEALRLVDRAVAILGKNDGGDPLALANALTSQSSLLDEAGRPREALAAAMRALDIVRANAPQSPLLLATVFNAGTVLSNLDRLDESDVLLREALALAERDHGADAAALWPVLGTLAANAASRGDEAAQARHTQRALDLARKIYPQAHPWTASSLVDRGLQVSLAGERERGEALIAEGIAMYDQLDSPDVLTALRAYGASQAHHGDHAAALRSLERAHALCLRHRAPGGRICLAIRANRADAMAHTGHPAEALPEATAALAALQSDPLRYSEQAQAMQARASALAGLGRTGEARAELERALALITARLGAGHPETRRLQARRDRLR